MAGLALKLQSGAGPLPSQGHRKLAIGKDRASVCGMRLSNVYVGLSVFSLCAIAHWADGSDIGKLVVGSLVPGLAVAFHARAVDDSWKKVVIAAIYVASIAFGSMALLLTKKALGEAPSAHLLENSSIMTVVFAWVICTFVFERQGAPQSPQHSP